MVKRNREFREFTKIVNEQEGLRRAAAIIRKFQKKAAKSLSCCTDATGAQVEIINELLKKRPRGARIITEINVDNMRYLRRVSKIAEVRHLGGIGVGVNFLVSESEYTGHAENPSQALEYTYSNAKSAVKQHQFIFNTFWEKATPASRRIEQIEQGLPAEKTEVIYLEHNVVAAILAWQNNSEKVWNLCVDSSVPKFSMSGQIKKGYLDAKARGIRIRYITEITKKNLQYCKEIMNFAELRHLDRVVGNFAVSEKDYMGEASHKDFLSHVIYSNKKEVVEQQTYIFENLWNNSIHAEKRIKEIEESTFTVQTSIIENPYKIGDKIKSEIINSNEIIACYQAGRLQLIYDNFFDLYKDVMARQRKGKHKGIRLIVTINKKVLDLVKQFLKVGVHVRHVKNLLPLSFVVTDKEVQANLEDIKGRKIVQSLLTSNEPAYVKQFASAFEQLWNEGIDARLKIKDLEEGGENEIEVIQSPSRTLELYSNILEAAKEDIMLIFPTTNAIIRQEKWGILDQVKEAAEDRSVHARLMMPTEASNIPAVSALLANTKNKGIDTDTYTDIDIRFIGDISGRATVLIVDKRIALVMELKDDSKDNFLDAIGLSTYSNSKAGILSYIALFENLWLQTELMSKLKIHDRMQEEFINIAAHELRTPIQPILSLTESLDSDVTSAEGKRIVEIIVRNAKRLERLAEDILDVTRIESQTFRLNKQNFRLKEILKPIIIGFKDEIKAKGANVKLKLDLGASDIFVEVDKIRFSQVITNLLTNALRFTVSGKISVAVTKLNSNSNSNAISISIRDTGQGIDPEIMPRLFTKFATKSLTGTGLGLFISKSIVEAHGGTIWAQNNTRGKGATFTFTLPVESLRQRASYLKTI